MPEIIDLSEPYPPKQIKSNDHYRSETQPSLNFLSSVFKISC
jgi:hypothetical protein